MGNANVSVSYDQITPAKAESFLSKNHELQRDINPNKVRMLIREMLKEDFCPHVNDIMFDVNGKLINGQHTLSAIVETGKTYNICVKRGLPDRVPLILMDTGARRTPSDRYFANYKERVTSKEFEILKILSVPFTAKGHSSDSAWTDPFMKYAKDVRDEWKQYLYLWANGPLCSKGKPHGFGKSPSADVAAAVITAIRAFPTRVSDLRRWSYIATYGKPFKNEEQKLTTLEEMTAKRWYKDGPARKRVRSPKMDNYRELTRLLWIYFELDGPGKVLAYDYNPFEDHFED